MTISIYTTGFNLRKNGFDVQDALNNFQSFADEVVVCVNRSTDDTLSLVNSSKNHALPNLKVVEADVSYEDPLLDGKLKDIALQATTYPMKVGLDMDERVPLRDRDLWLGVFHMLERSEMDAVMIPSVNLWGSRDSVKEDLPDLLRSRKWYLHKSGLMRGPVNFARKPDGTVDTSKSDTCELIRRDGTLAHSFVLQPRGNTMEEALRDLGDKYPFVFHLGYESFKNRIDRNKNFWQNHWQVESGGTPPLHKVHMNESEFTEKTIKHNLKYWNE